MMASFELAWRRVFLFDLSSAEQGWCSSSLWLRNPGFGHVPSAWRRWHSVPKATLERGRSVEFPSEGNVSGYVCNHSSLRMGTRHCVSWPCFGHSCRSPLKKKGWCVPQVPFYARRRSLACVIGVHLPMSGALGVVIMLQVTGHAGGVPKATLERGRSVSFPFSENYGYIRNLRRFAIMNCISEKPNWCWFVFYYSTTTFTFCLQTHFCLRFSTWN